MEVLVDNYAFSHSTDCCYAGHTSLVAHFGISYYRYNLMGKWLALHLEYWPCVALSEEKS